MGLIRWPLYRRIMLDYLGCSIISSRRGRQKISEVRGMWYEPPTYAQTASFSDIEGSHEVKNITVYRS